MANVMILDRNRLGDCSLLVSLSVALATLPACGSDRKQDVTTVTIGVLPDQDQKLLEKRFAPLLVYLRDTIGTKFDIVFVSSYEELLQRFQDGTVQMAYFGGVTFLQAEKRFGAIPLVMRDVDMRFQTAFLVSADSPAEDVSDMKGKKLSFGAKLSTSGHLMPRYFLNRSGIEPEKFFSVVLFSGTHDKTALAVQNGTVDLGAANGTIVDRMFADGTLDKARVRVLSRSPPYPDYVWAVQKGLPETLRNRIRNAFLGLTNAQAEQALILRNLQAESFLPAVSRDFQPLRDIMNERGLL